MFLREGKQPHQTISGEGDHHNVQRNIGKSPAPFSNYSVRRNLEKVLKVLLVPQMQVAETLKSLFP